MSSPIQSSPFGQVSGYQSQEQNVKKEEEKAKEVEALEEVPEQEESELEKEFSSLISRYYTTIQITAGCGDLAQGYIDSEWRKLTKFADEHPEFKSRLPKSKQKSYDDGTGGMASGMASLASDFRRRDEDCVIS
jgi:hypothetical protein